MATNASFIAKDDLGFSQQLEQFVNKIPAYATTLGVSTGEVDDIKKDSEFFAYVLTWMGLFRDYSLNATKYKDLARKGNNDEVLGDIPAIPAPGTAPALVPANIQKRFSDLCARIKKSPNYTTGIGEDLGIEAPHTPFVPQDGKPNLSAKLASGGHPLLHFTKGKYEGAQIWKDTGTGFALFATAIRPDYLDDSTLPAANTSVVWKYKAIYLYADAVVGSWSDVVSITVTGE